MGLTLIEVGLPVKVMEACAVLDGSARLAAIRTIVCNVFMTTGAA
jgi:hypothetical protein